MSQSPAPITASRVALMPDGNVAEVVLDNTGKAFARWNNGSWSQWWLVATPAVDVSVGGATVSSADTACVSVTFRNGDRGYYVLTSSGVSGTDL